MGKIIYVRGSIDVRSRYFFPKDAGCLYMNPPEGAIVVEPNSKNDGGDCLLVDDDHPQSLFNEYYARDGITTESILSSYLSASYFDSINEYRIKIEGICNVVRKVESWDEEEKNLLYKMAYVNVLTALDAFLCYVLLKRSVQDEKLFKSVMFKLAPKSKTEKWLKLIENGQDGEWEQDAIRYVQETSLINIDKIDCIFKKLKFKKLVYDRKEMDKCFRIRHLLVHRSGKNRDDDEIVITYSMLVGLINTTHTIVGAIFDSICITLTDELKNKPKEPDIEEIYPGGVVTAPFKISDLYRLLNSNASKSEFEPIKMPIL
jgi:hypothetical protein